MARIAEYKKIGVNEAGVPVTGTVYRDATPEEIAEMEQWQPETLHKESTPEERIAELEKQNAMLLDCVLEMSEIIYA